MTETNFITFKILFLTAQHPHISQRSNHIDLILPNTKIHNAINTNIVGLIAYDILGKGSQDEKASLDVEQADAAEPGFYLRYFVYFL